jgi:TonB family protein
MKLAGDLAEFSLADLVQVAGVAGRTCCVRVMAGDGNGAIHLDRGEVVSASFENLTGFDAFVALVAARAGHFQVENGVVAEQHNLQANVQKLLLEANARIEEGRVPRPRARQLPAAAGGAALAATAGAAAPADTAGRRHAPGWLIGGGAAGLLLLGAVSWLAFARHDVAVRGAAAPPAPDPVTAAQRQAVEATQLIGPGDAAPALAAGQPPAAPDPAATLKPTIVCRLLVGSDGRVLDARVYRSRLDLAAFEDAAVDAVRGFRFIPGKRGGSAIQVWINWPVAFR